MQTAVTFVVVLGRARTNQECVGGLGSFIVDKVRDTGNSKLVLYYNYNIDAQV